MENKQRGTIFLVEDNADIRNIYRLYFELAGFKVETANDGLDCLARISDIKPDVILLDIMMPEMDGFDMLKYMRQNFSDEKLKHVLIIVWSNLSQPEDVDKSISLGANEYLRKSDYEGETLVNKVIEIFDKFKK